MCVCTHVSTYTHTHTHISLLCQLGGSRSNNIVKSSEDTRPKSQFLKLFPKERYQDPWVKRQVLVLGREYEMCHEGRKHSPNSTTMEHDKEPQEPTEWPKLKQFEQQIMLDYILKFNINIHRSML